VFQASVALSSAAAKTLYESHIVLLVSYLMSPVTTEAYLSMFSMLERIGSYEMEAPLAMRVLFTALVRIIARPNFSVVVTVVT